jgi:hypothetical protein
MRRITPGLSLFCIGLCLAACKDKKQAGAPKAVEKAAQSNRNVKKTAGLNPDKAFASGTIPGATMSLETHLKVEGLAGSATPEKKGEPQKNASPSAFSQTMAVADGRGKMVFTTGASYIAQGTELRYHAPSKKYLLATPTPKIYWSFSGPEVGNLLEGGPRMARSNYRIKVKETKERQKLVGYDTQRSDVALSFDYSVKMKSGEKKGKISVSLAIWHSQDKKLKSAWGDLMVDYLTFPFQDGEGEKVVALLKSKLGFPLKWNMEVKTDDDSTKKTTKKGADTGDRTPPTLVTEVKTLALKDIARAELAVPPVGYAAATGPFQFGEDGQTVSEATLANLPPEPGEAPKAPGK